MGEGPHCRITMGLQGNWGRRGGGIPPGQMAFVWWCGGGGGGGWRKASVRVPVGAWVYTLRWVLRRELST